MKLRQISSGGVSRSPPKSTPKQSLGSPKSIPGPSRDAPPRQSSSQGLAGASQARRRGGLTVPQECQGCPGAPEPSPRSVQKRCEATRIATESLSGVAKSMFFVWLAQEASRECAFCEFQAFSRSVQTLQSTAPVDQNRCSALLTMDRREWSAGRGIPSEFVSFLHPEWSPEGAISSGIEAKSWNFVRSGVSNLRERVRSLRERVHWGGKSLTEVENPWDMTPSTPTIRKLLL